jgi:cytochrome oxidase Cu insertion factor (SCO1/SenC/PrrC family)
MQERSKSRIYFIALFAVFFGPLLFAMWLFYVPNSWINTATQNHGTLVQPVQPLGEFTLNSINGGTWSYQDFLGKWTLLYIGDERCDLYCEANLFKMRQVRLTLGRDSQRVQRKYLGIYKHKSTQAVTQIFAKYPQMQAAWFDLSKINEKLPQFNELSLHQVYLVDPLGNIMMWYPKEATSKGMKKDLKRLLKVSRIG